ncbi:uncharacterized protein LOC118468778 [Anopheles albimanus]|uniref:Uncharacterized protein n=1 Tax=Anopheles albimanus TaxID=7167 RepID=A0A182FAP9_ANOAL|nr:uncharacterized protein LOC118468778 [Anopheles albimanus]
MGNPVKSRICRLCLSQDELQVSVYSEYARRLRLLNKIKRILPIEIEPDDPLPKTVCSCCLMHVNKFYEFYNTTLSSKRVLVGMREDIPDPPNHSRTRGEVLPVFNISDDDSDHASSTRSPSAKRQADRCRPKLQDLEEILTQSPQIQHPPVTIPSSSTVSSAVAAVFFENRLKQNPKKKLNFGTAEFK